MDAPAADAYINFRCLDKRTVRVELLSAPTSPFARKVLITMLELKLEDRITVTNVQTATDERLPTLNPLGKIPALARPWRAHFV